MHSGIKWDFVLGDMVQVGKKKHYMLKVIVWDHIVKGDDSLRVYIVFFSFNYQVYPFLHLHCACEVTPSVVIV